MSSNLGGEGRERLGWEEGGGKGGETEGREKKGEERDRGGGEWGGGGGGEGDREAG